MTPEALSGRVTWFLSWAPRGRARVPTSRMTAVRSVEFRSILVCIMFLSVLRVLRPRATRPRGLHVLLRRILRFVTEVVQRWYGRPDPARTRTRLRLSARLLRSASLALQARDLSERG